MMKKLLIVILCLAMCLAVLNGCKNKQEQEPEQVQTPESSQRLTPTPAPTITPSAAPTTMPVATPDTTPVTSPVIERFPFTEENFPRIDGSTATIPLIEAVTSALLGKPRSEVNINVSKTSGAYVALANNEADILLVYDGGEETRREVNADTLFETVPIGKDALIFVVNKDNPIDSLTTEQMRKIFSGEYTSWSEVGGSNEPIRAYQRGIGSGSQALMDKLVMDGFTMADPAMVPVIESMGGLIEVVANFAGGPSGIGYNVYYYVTEMRGNDYIKILSIDGVEPSYNTIQSGEYPFVSEFYSVIRKSEPEGSPVRALHEWMLSEEAQNLMVRERYVALHANPDADTSYVDGSFSFYPEGEAPEYFEGVNPYTLEARDDYGQLYFYLGTTRRGEDSIPRFYGLCTAEGKIVTEPVYTAPLLLTDSSGNRAYFCYRADREPVEGTAYPALLFSTDGLWVKEFDGAMPCYGFRGAADMIVNADILAVMLGGKWGAVNMKGETVIPFTLDRQKDIYKDNDHASLGYLGVTGDRFMRSDGYSVLYDLYDGEFNLISSGLYGMPSGMVGDYIVTNGWGDMGITVYTYTLDGELIASLEQGDDREFGWAEPFGSYVRIPAGKYDLICDRELNILYELENLYDDSMHNGYYSTLVSGPNVLYETDRDTLFHRTYLPDGSRLVTWFDPDMGEY